MISDGLEKAVIQHFARDVVSWQKEHGRNQLPWQNTREPYKVWLSEIMLQQTQVATVLDYYARFLVKFPRVADLAEAKLDDVLALWSGLGYYSRARNLHRCAGQVMALHDGRFPQSAAQLQGLPGIGPSTAAAIAAFCFSERVAIMDGNVKRVLTRALAFDGDLAQVRSEKELWVIATGLLPRQNLQEQMPRYTQGLMDLGATVCTLRKPKCGVCPLQGICKGLATGEPQNYPVKTRKLKRSAHTMSLLWAQRPDGSVWLERRPAAGIWGGLYCMPVFESEDALKAFLPAELQERLQFLKPFKHVLTHKDLYLRPVIAGFEANQKMLAAVSSLSEPEPVGAWFAASEWAALGLPAPVRKLLKDERA